MHQKELVKELVRNFRKIRRKISKKFLENSEKHGGGAQVKNVR